MANTHFQFSENTRLTFIHFKYESPFPFNNPALLLYSFNVPIFNTIVATPLRNNDTVLYYPEDRASKTTFKLDKFVSLVTNKVLARLSSTRKRPQKTSHGSHISPQNCPQLHHKKRTTSIRDTQGYHHLLLLSPHSTWLLSRWAVCTV